MPEPEKSKDEEARKAAAESIRRQIADLKAGRRKPGPTRSLRDFVEEKMAEEQEKQEKDE
jgi:hypothetical protein